MNLYQPTISGSLEVSGSVTINGTLRVLSGSISGTASIAENSLLLGGLDSGSFQSTSSFSSFSSSLSTRLVTDEANIATNTAASSSFAAQSASLSTRLTTDESNFSNLSSSFATTSGSISSRVTIIEGQDATTGSNVFSGTQNITDTSNAISFTSTASLYTDGGLRVAKDSYVSGTAYFNNVVVYGTSSIEYITSSQVDIGTNIIYVNTDTPAVRFGGLAVYDSGSTQLTGSMLWDSEANHWVYSNPSGSTYSGGMIMSGPRAASLGTEQGTTNNALMKGQGGDHITSSQMFDDGTTVRIPGNLQVTGSLVNTGAATFSSSVTAGKITTLGTAGLPSSSTLSEAIVLIQDSGSNRRLGIGSSTSGQWIQSSYPGVEGIASTLLLNSSGGNVGIGTTSPSYLLDVSGSGRFTSNFTVFSPTTGATSGDLLVDTSTKYVYVGRLSGVSGDNTTFQVRDRLGTARATLPGGGSIDTVFSLNSSNFIVTNYSSNALMTITNSGAATFSSNVNIDGERLTIGGNTNNAIINNIASVRVNIDCDNNATGESFMIGHNQTGIDNNNVLFKVQDDGKVGIGTISPDAKLDVQGSSNTGTSFGNFIVKNNVSAGISMGNSSTSYNWIQSNLYGAGTLPLSLNPVGGNVGIGMSAPSQKLHVVGAFLQTYDNSSWYRNVFERNVSTWDNVVGFSPQSSPQYTYGYINITASGYVNGTSAGGVTTSRWYYSITNNSISVSVVGSDISSGSQAPSIRLVVSSGTIYVQVQSATPAATCYATIFVDAMLASGYVNGTYWIIS